MRYRPHIDGLRALAVVPVVLFHAGVPGFDGGFVGVDVFFVISGFLITSLLAKELAQDHFSIVAFYERRARRILPALFTVILVCAVLAWACFMSREFVAFGKSAIAATLFSSNILFWSEAGYFDEAANLKPLLHTWSLAVEEQFYIFFPIILYLTHRYCRAYSAAVIGLLFVMSFGLNVWGLSKWPDATFYLAPARAWELLLGSLLALLVRPAENRSWLTEMSGAAGIGLIALSVALYDDQVPFPGLRAAVPCLGAGLIIWSGETGPSLARRLLSRSVLVAIGLISYSLYLWHWPALVFTRYILMREPGPLELVLLLAATVVLAYLTWKFIETPVRRGSFWSGKAIATAGTAASLATIAFGASVVWGNGLPWRLAPEVLAILHGRSDPNAAKCHNATAERAKAGKICTRGASDKEPTFVLVGDSHANSLSPGVFEAAKDKGLSGYHFTNSGFRPLPQGDKRRTDMLDPADFIDFLRENSHVKLVIVAGFWELAASGKAYNRKHGAAHRTKEAFAKGLVRLLEPFPDRQFVFLTDYPTGWSLDPRFVARARHLGRHLDVGLSRHQYEQQLATYQTILEDTAKSGHASVVPVADVFCNQTVCSQVRDGKTLYRDGDHLSSAGAMLLVDTMRQIFDRAKVASNR